MSALKLKNISETEQQIELLVRSRSADAAVRQIQAHLRQSQYNESSLNLAFESYRRLGLFKIGYALCVRMLGKPAQNKRFLSYWLARFLHLRGATAYSRHLLAQFPPETALENHFAATIYYSDFDFQTAEFHARQYFLFTDIRESRAAKIAALLWADALMGMNRATEALIKAEEVIKHADDDTLLAIALTAKGEYLARYGNYEQAAQELTLARLKLPADDFTYDSSLILLWQGYVDCKTGKETLGLKKIQQAYQNMCQQNLRPETRLECLRILMELRGAPQTDIIKLAYYPGVSEGFKSQFRNAALLEDYSAGETATDTTAKWQVHLNTNEYRTEKQWNYNIPMDLQLAAHLRLAYPHSVPLVRMASILYPFSPLLVDKFERRIHQLMFQLEQGRGLTVSLESGSLVLAAESIHRISASNGRTKELKALDLKNIDEKIQARLFATTYGISQPQARRYLGEYKSLIS